MSNTRVRRVRGLSWVEAWLYDLRFAVRRLRRDYGFTATVIATLALAIGLNVTVFVVMQAMLFRGFPLVQGNDRLVYLQERSPGTGQGMPSQDFEQWRAQAASFEAMALVGGTQVTLADGGRPLDTFARKVSPNLFQLLGVRPLLGRDFVATDDRPDAPAVAILSYPFWQTRFGGRADIVGHTVRIDEAVTTVIGVMPEGFTFPEQENLWLPLVRLPGQPGTNGYLGVARLAPGATVARARAEIDTIAQRLAAASPTNNGDRVTRVQTYSQFFIGPDAPMIYGSLWGATWFVLLIACANLANLALARAVRRSGELTTRIALGAGRWRMIRQLLLEGVLLAGAGGAAAWWVAAASVRVWAAATQSDYQILDYTIDIGTVAYLAAISMLAALLFSLMPIGRVVGLDIHSGLRGESGYRTPWRRTYLQPALIAGQMALAIVLLAGAGVLARSFWKVVSADVGVRTPQNVLVGRIALPRETYATPESSRTFFGVMRTRLATVPGIESVSVADVLPVDGLAPRQTEVEVPSNVAARMLDNLVTVHVGADYFRTVGATTILGREFDTRDGADGPAVAIINESFAKRFFAGRSPLGRRLRLYAREDGGLQPLEWRTIVGVVSNVMQADPTRQRFAALVYVPFGQEPSRGAWFLARTRAEAGTSAAAVRAAIAGIGPDLTIAQVSSLQETFRYRAEQMDLAHVEMGKHAAVAPIFAAIALLLAVVGLYAVVANTVDQRTREIGVRMALGAAARDIRRTVFSGGMRPVVAGVLTGLAASTAVNGILESQLVGVRPWDPVTLAAAPAILVLVALLACYLPARRAVRVNPVVALRHD